MAAINTMGITIPIATFAPFDRPVLVAVDGLDVLELELVDIGATLTLVFELRFEVDEVPFGVTCAASRDTTCMSVLCHITGMPSHSADVSFGTIHCAAMFFFDGMLSTDPTVGVADQMFVIV